MSFISDMQDAALLQMAARVQEEIELRGLPDRSFQQGYKAGFLAALCDQDYGPGQVWSHEERKGLFQELDRRFAA